MDISTRRCAEGNGLMRISGASLARVDRNSTLYKRLVGVHEQIAQKDPSTWGPEAATEAAVRLNWVDLPESSRTLLPEIDALTAKFRHIPTIVLAGMGGSSLAPEVIAKSFRRDLFILDSTDPNYLAHAINGDLASTLVVVSSKSGSTIETSSARAAFAAAFTKAGLEIAEHMVVVTDPDSPLDRDARAQGISVTTADPHVGGRFSALSAFGLVPSALAGVDVSLLLDAASECKKNFLADSAAIIDVAWLLTTQTEQYLAFIDSHSGMPGLSDWIEQLVAESTGKSGVGRLPIAAEDLEGAAVGGAFTISFSEMGADLTVEGELGEHFIFWEWLTALVGAALQIDPFNQPNVTEAKNATSTLLTEWGGQLPVFTPEHSEKSVEIFGDGNSVIGSLQSFVSSVADGGYISIHAYLDRRDDARLEELRKVLSLKTGHPVTFGWGPRFLHSTGQFHKGGQQNGAFLQITGEASCDFAIPGSNFGFKTLVMAQALGDNRALGQRKFPLLRLHLQDRSAGITQILEAARSL
jgi:glucose-6-phosphate isomerase